MTRVITSINRRHCRSSLQRCHTRLCYYTSKVTWTFKYTGLCKSLLHVAPRWHYIGVFFSLLSSFPLLSFLAVWCRLYHLWSLKAMLTCCNTYVSSLKVWAVSHGSNRSKRFLCNILSPSQAQKTPCGILRSYLSVRRGDWLCLFRYCFDLYWPLIRQTSKRYLNCPNSPPLWSVCYLVTCPLVGWVDSTIKLILWKAFSKCSVDTRPNYVCSTFTHYIIKRLILPSPGQRSRKHWRLCLMHHGYLVFESYEIIVCRNASERKGCLHVTDKVI